METPDKLPLYPAWRQAEVQLLAQGLTYGSLVTDEQLKMLLGIPEPKTVADVTRIQLLFMSQREALRESLLENHQMMLRRTEGIGYTVVPPEQQTRIALEDRTREVKRALSKLAREVSHVQQEQLTDAQRKENADAIAKVGSLSGMVRKQLNGPK